jgi:group I intron endonuclease
MPRNKRDIITGVYMICNIANNKIYIGSSFNVYARISAHIRLLNKGKHENEYLQHSFNKHKKECFEFVMLETCEKNDKNDKIIKEQWWLDALEPYKRDVGYNISEKASGGPGTKSKICKIDGCSMPHLTRGLCNKHRLRLKRSGHTEDVYLKQMLPIENRGCLVEGCLNKHDMHHYCAKHHYYIKKYGKIQDPKIVFDPDRGCSVPQCNKKHAARGLCHSHYEIWRYHHNKPI